MRYCFYILLVCMAIALPKANAADNGVKVEGMHFFLSRQGETVKINILFRVDFASVSGAPPTIAFPIPANLQEVNLAEMSDEGVRMVDDSIVMDVPKQPGKKKVAFDGILPIENESIRWHQPMNVPVSRVQVLSSWIAEGSSLQGVGFQAAFKDKIGRDTQGWVMLQDDNPKGELDFTLSGLGADVHDWLNRITLGLSILIVALGVIAALRRKRPAVAKIPSR